MIVEEYDNKIVNYTNKWLIKQINTLTRIKNGILAIDSVITENEIKENKLVVK